MVSGDRARALRTYHACATTLERELGVAPSQLTRDVYEALLPSERAAVDAAPQGARVDSVPLVGRAPERTRLTALWRATEAGRASLALVTGEAGVGKTRLVEALHAWCTHRGVLTAEARSYAAEGALAYGPVMAWLRSEAIMTRITRLDPGHPDLVQLARVLPELSTERPGRADPELLPERERRQRLFGALTRALLAPGGPLLLVADDLQWCDRETLQFLHYLVRSEPGARVLVVATARREDLDQPHPLHDLIRGLQALERVTEIPLARLTRAETAMLARHVVRAPLDEPEVSRLYSETEGNPLFVVEALRAGWRRGPHERGQLSARIQALIDSRLALLSAPARSLIGVAATIGRAWSTDLLATASGVDEDTLIRSLDELWRRQIVREQGTAAYDFSHDTIREIAYLRLSPAVRQRHHLQVARALQRLDADDPGPARAQIAMHYEQAGAGDQAITWYQRAAEQAQQLHASREAVRLLDRALHLLAALPATPRRQARELTVLTALPALLLAGEGYRSRRIIEVQQRALVLTRELGVEPEPPLLRSLALASLSQDAFAEAHGLGERLRTRATRDGDDVLLVESAYVLGIAAFWQGELAAARRHFETAVEQYRPEHRRAHLVWYGQDPKVICMTRLGNTLWFLGQPDAARRARDAACALADEIGHPYTRSTARVFAGMLALELRDPGHLRACVALLKAGHAEQEARQTRISSDALEGYLDVLDGQAETGIARIQRVLAESLGAERAPGQHAMVVRVLLEACAAAGAARLGREVADRALAMTGGARVWHAEIHRLRGEFLAALGGPASEVDAAFERAFQVAQRQGAQALALRAATSLVRHRVACGHGPDARAAFTRLAALVDGSPEGRDTPDLREASALLDRR